MAHLSELSESYWKDRDVLVTGISGFMGSHLAEKLLSMGSHVHGLLRRHAFPSYPNIEHLRGKIDLVEGDLMDTPSLLTALEKSGASVIFHLAAQSFVPLSFEAPAATYESNVLGTANLLEAVRRSSSVEKMQFAGSSEEYGLVHPDEIPIKETNPMRPLSPYAASKVAGDYICYTHYKCYGVPVVRTRAFNHTGPRHGFNYVVSVIARQVARGVKYKQKELTIGNPEPRRDFSDVRDILRGYMLAIEKGKPGEAYNFGSGKSISIGDLARLCIRLGGLENRMKVLVDKSRYRPVDVMLIECDYSKAKKELGWAPSIPLEQTLKDLIDYFLEREDLLLRED